MTLLDDAVTDDGTNNSHESSFADMVERLFAEFENRIALNEIVTVVRDAREQLRGSPLGALPELTERLAVQRLTALTAAQPPRSHSATAAVTIQPN